VDHVAFHLKDSAVPASLSRLMKAVSGGESITARDCATQCGFVAGLSVSLGAHPSFLFQTILGTLCERHSHVDRTCNEYHQ
jgi:hypothetical protein